jgi:hypothetical protein
MEPSSGGVTADRLPLVRFMEFGLHAAHRFLQSVRVKLKSPALISGGGCISTILNSFSQSWDDSVAVCIYYGPQLAMPAGVLRHLVYWPIRINKLEYQHF